MRTQAVHVFLALVFLAGTGRADDREDAEFFRTRIEPVLSKHCYECHSAKSAELKGGLRLDHRAGPRDGGESGPAVVPGDPDESLLILALGYGDDFYQMPPAGKLSDAVLDDFRKWIAMGAPDPRDDDDPVQSRRAYDRPAAASGGAEGGYRHPVALQLSAGEAWLYVANRGTGSLSVIDLANRTVAAEIPVLGQMSDLARVGDSNFYLATDESAHELVLLRLDGAQARVERRMAVSPYPVSVAVGPDGRWASVASLWSRRITLVDLAGKETPALRTRNVIDLPIAPRAQLVVREGSHLVAADSFGGQLAVINVGRGELERVRSFPGHNIRGLRQSEGGRMLVVAHQMLNEFAHTIQNDVHWGLLMSNDLRWLRLRAVLDDDTREFYSGAHMHPLGEAGAATGDPSGLAIAPDGTVVVTLGGVDEVAFGKESDFTLRRVRVGRRPTGVVVSGDSKRAYVTNSFDDSVTIVALDRQEVDAEISLGPLRPLTLVERGARLFFDARLSHDGWMSCHSCHTDGHTNGQPNDNFTDESFGTPKRVLSLLGRADTAPFAWNGSIPQLEEQVRKSISSTMQSDYPPRDEDVAALAAFVSSLDSAPSLDRLRGVENGKAIERGRAIFEQQKCATCHTPPSYTSAAVYDVGLQDELGNRKFNPPSLRGAGQRSGYFHDGRAATLEEVFDRFGHQLREPLDAGEIADLVAFLRGLE